MNKFLAYSFWCVCLLYTTMANGQTKRIVLIPVDSAATNVITQLSYKDTTSNLIYINSLGNTLIQQLYKKGYFGASIDEQVNIKDTVRLKIYVGNLFQKLTLNFSDSLLPYLNGIVKNNALNISPNLWEQQSKIILDNAANAGYPFASLQIQPQQINNEGAIANLVFNTGSRYTIDSVHLVNEDVNISNSFIARYLGIKANTYYNSKLINSIADKINKLPYLSLAEAPQLKLLNTGAYIDLNLKPKSANKANVLLGLVPKNGSAINNPNATSTDNGYSIIGEAAISLWNVLGAGEYFSLQFQQLIPKNPRFNFSTKVPYLLGSPFPIELNFELYKRDSLFQNITANLATEVNLKNNQFVKFGFQLNQTNTIGINTNEVLFSKRLPNYIDSRFYGFLLNYKLNKHENVFYPIKKGSITAQLVGGTRRVLKSNAIINLKDPNNPNFNYNTLYDTVAQQNPQVKWNGLLQHFIKLKKLKVLRVALQGGVLVSNKVFFNEQFLLGGIKNLRGFNEESEPASLYAIGTVEFRIPAGSNAYLLALTDGAIIRNSLNASSKTGIYGSIGAGIAINTKGGILNLIIANGNKQGQSNFRLGAAKLHISYDVLF
jgi:outer membrane protein insertion porin family